MPARKKSYLSGKIVLKKSPIGKGLFAKSLILKDEVIVDYTGGPGQFISRIEADNLYSAGNDYMLQVGDNEFFSVVYSSEIESADFINHSCEPNLGFSGKLKLVAMRDIYPGEEITFDYAMSESSEFEMDCFCGSENCRGVVTGEDWKKPELQRRYSNFYSDYLKEKFS